MAKESFFLKRSVVATIGIIGLLGGFVFLNVGGVTNPLSGQVTGNFVLNSFSSFSIISMIGLLLILFSAALIVYSFVKR